MSTIVEQSRADPCSDSIVAEIEAAAPSKTLEGHKCDTGTSSTTVYAYFTETLSGAEITAVQTAITDHTYVEPDASNPTIMLGDAALVHENETHPPFYLFGQTGLNDVTSSGLYTLDGSAVFQLRIVTTNSFEWRKGISGAYTGPVTMTGSAQLLQDGISVAFPSATGYTIADEWEMNVGHEVHLSESLHVKDDTTIEGDLVIIGNLRSLRPLKIQEAIDILCDEPTDRAKLTTSCSGIDFGFGETDRISIETNGMMKARTANYETLVIGDNDIPNRKFVVDAVSGGLGTHIVEGPADTDIIAKDPGDPTKIITIAPFKLRTVTATNGIASIKSIVSVPAGVEVTNTIPAFTGGWLGIRETAGTYEFFSKPSRNAFDTSTECPIGRADRTATDISAIVSLAELGFGYAQDLYDFMADAGSAKLSGGDLQAIEGGLTLKRLEGEWRRYFAGENENQRHYMTNTIHNPITAYEIHSSYGDIEIPTEMEVGFIDDGAGGKTAIGADEWSYYLCYHWPRHTGVGYEGYQRSTRSFISLHEARALRGQGIPEMHPALDAAVLTHIIYIKGDATDLGNPEQCSVEWVRKDNISSSGDPLVGGLQQSGVIDWDGTEILTINADPTKFDRGEIRIGFVDRETGVKFIRTVPSATAQTVTNLTADPFTFYGYNIDTNSFIQQSMPMERTTLNNIIPIGLIWHRNKTIIDLAQTMPLVVETSHDYAGQLLAFGALKQSGLNLSANGANKKVNSSTGVLEVLGGTSTSRENISNASPTPEIPLSFTPVHRAVTTGKVVFETVTDDPDYDVFDDGSGTLVDLSPNNFGIHYFYIFPFRTTVDVFLIRGDQSYATVEDALIGLQQNPIPIPSDFKSGFPFSAVIAKKGTTNLQTAITAGDAVITPSDRFGSFGAGGGGGGGISSVVEDTTPQSGGDWDVFDKTFFNSGTNPVTIDGSTLTGVKSALRISNNFGDGNYIDIGNWRRIGVVEGGTLFMGYNTDWDTTTNGYKRYGANPAAGIEYTTDGKVRLFSALTDAAGTAFTPTYNLVVENNGNVKLLNGVGINEFSSDGTLTGDSDSAVPTEKAVKTYVDGAFSEVETSVTVLFDNFDARFFGELGLPDLQDWLLIQGGAAVISIFNDTIFGIEKDSVKFTTTDTPVKARKVITALDWENILEFGASYSGVVRFTEDINTNSLFSGMGFSAANDPRPTSIRSRLGVFISENGTNTTVKLDGQATVILDGNSGVPNVPVDTWFSFEAVVHETPDAGVNFGAVDFYVNGILVSSGSIIPSNSAVDDEVSVGNSSGDGTVTFYVDHFGVTIYKESPDKLLSVENMATDKITVIIPSGQRDYTITIPDDNPRGIGDGLNVLANNIEGTVTLRSEDLNAPQTLFNGLGLLLLDIFKIKEVRFINTVENGNVYQAISVIAEGTTENQITRWNGSYWVPSSAILVRENDYVGFGTPDPDRMIHVKGPNANIHIEREAETGATIFLSNINGTNTTHWKIEALNSWSGAGKGSLIISNDGIDSGGVSTARLTIDENGNVDIGGLLEVNSPSSHTYLKLNTTAADLVSNLELFNNDVHKWSISSKGAKDVPNDRLSIYNASAALEVMSFLQNGSVGVGSTNPDNGRLVVAIPSDTDATLIAFDEGFGGGGANNFKLIGKFTGTGAANTLLLQDFNGNTNMAWTAAGNAGIGTPAPDASAKLELASTTQGFLGPRGTTTERTNISSPAEGLEFYDLTLHQKFLWNGTSWVILG